MPGTPEQPPLDPLPGPEDVAPRRLTRSTTEKYVAGVSGGLGRYFGIDPLIFRVAFGAATLVSGVGIIAYIVLAAFLPKDDGEAAWMADRSKFTTIALTGVLAVIAVSMLAPPAFFLGPGLFGIAALTLAGIGLYRAFGGNFRDDPARAIARATLVAILLAAALGAGTAVGFVAAIGGGTAMAILAIVAGLGLVATGMLGGPRWLILPVIVLVLPLAVVSAADIDLRGGVGERTYRPATVADLRPEYKLGVGQMNLDLRRVTLPPGTTEVHLRLGMGEARVRVPANACVTTAAKIGVGAADLPERVDQGLDIDVDRADRENRRPRLVVNADVGVGHLQVDRSACA